jgi:hypothetical protein
MLFNVVHVRHFLPRRHHNEHAMSCREGIFASDLVGCKEGKVDELERWKVWKDWL